jgi:hypothetical protein
MIELVPPGDGLHAMFGRKRLEIEDQRVGRGLPGVFEFALAVAGNEQE